MAGIKVGILTMSIAGDFTTIFFHAVTTNVNKCLLFLIVRFVHDPHLENNFAKKCPEGSKLSLITVNQSSTFCSIINFVAVYTSLCPVLTSFQGRPATNSNSNQFYLLFMIAREPLLNLVKAG